MSKGALSTASNKNIPNRAGSGVYIKGRKRIEEMLREAIELLEEVGPAGFSMRALANRMGVSISAIQHYFPSRSDLMSAVAIYFQDQYLDQQKEVLTKDYTTDIERLEGFLEFLIDDTAQTTFLIESALLSEASTSTPAMIPEMRKAYEAYIKAMISVLTPLTPQLTEEQRRSRAIVISATIDGLAVYFSPTLQLSAQTPSLAADTVSVLRRIALME